MNKSKHKIIISVLLALGMGLIVYTLYRVAVDQEFRSNPLNGLDFSRLDAFHENGILVDIDTTRNDNLFYSVSLDGLFWTRYYSYSQNKRLSAFSVERKSFFGKKVKFNYCYSLPNSIPLSLHRVSENLVNYVKKPWEFVLSEIDSSLNNYTLVYLHASVFKDFEININGEWIRRCREDGWNYAPVIIQTTKSGYIIKCTNEQGQCIN